MKAGPFITANFAARKCYIAKTFNSQRVFIILPVVELFKFQFSPNNIIPVQKVSDIMTARATFYYFDGEFFTSHFDGKFSRARLKLDQVAQQRLIPKVMVAYVDPEAIARYKNVDAFQASLQ